MSATAGVVSVFLVDAVVLLLALAWVAWRETRFAALRQVCARPRALK